MCVALENSGEKRSSWRASRKNLFAVVDPKREFMSGFRAPPPIFVFPLLSSLSIALSVLSLSHSHSLSLALSIFFRSLSPPIFFSLALSLSTKHLRPVLSIFYVILVPRTCGAYGCVSAEFSMVDHYCIEAWWRTNLMSMFFAPKSLD